MNKMKYFLISITLFSNLSYASPSLTEFELTRLEVSYNQCLDLQDSKEFKRVALGLGGGFSEVGGGLVAVKTLYDVATEIFGKRHTVRMGMNQTTTNIWRIPIGVAFSFVGHLTRVGSQNYYSFSHPQDIADVLADIIVNDGELDNALVLNQLMIDIKTLCLDKKVSAKGFCKRSNITMEKIVSQLLEASKNKTLCVNYISSEEKLYEGLLTE